jgi:hypothetical protein
MFLQPLPHDQETRAMYHTHLPHMNRGPQMTERWEEALRFIHRQGALRLDQLQKVLGRLSPDPERMKLPGVLSEERTRKILRRWRSEDLFVYKVFYVRQKGWLWLTRKGIKYTRLALRYYEPSPASLPHLAAINEIRLIIEARPKGSIIKHLPDAELISTHGNSIAIECELTIKSEKRLQEALYDLAANKRYNTIWYFCPQNVHDVLRRIISSLPPEHRPRFVLCTLEGKLYRS